MAQAKKQIKKLKKQLKQQNKLLKKHNKQLQKIEKLLASSTGQAEISPKTKSFPASITGLKPANNQSMAFARVPYKSSPCKKCPALMGGLCKCAIKKQAA